MAKRFDVAVWKYWPSYTFPLEADGVEASSAFAAVEQVMRAHRMTWAEHVAAVASDGSIHYRGYRVLLAQEVVSQVGLWDRAGAGRQGASVTQGELLFAWGQAHGFPELYWPLPECAELSGVMPAGEQAWAQARDQGVPQYIRAAYWTAMRTTRV